MRRIVTTPLLNEHSPDRHCHLRLHPAFRILAPVESAHRGIRLELKLPADPLPVLLDRSGMQEVFAHIVELACRAMKAGSTLHVLGRIDGTQAVVNFMDCAPGTDEPRLARCFDAASAHRARPRGDCESIASVALCTQIVGEHRGRIYAAPSPLGRLGISMRLPLQGLGARAASARL